MNTPSIKILSDATGHSNVGSAPSDVEHTRRAGIGLWGLMVLLAGVLAASGCVETAECNASVRCPDDQVCYEYHCRAICETDEQCESNEQCAPCVPEDSSDEQGLCFGREVNACVEEPG